MGCHTWCYKRTTLTLKEAFEAASKSHSASLPSERKRLKRGEMSQSHDLSFDDFSSWQHWFCKGSPDGLYLISEKGIFFEAPEYHDVFRVHSYFSVVLYSLEETLALITEHQIEDVEWEKLEDFWSRYSDGAISFG
jgi:hypothetical protein